MEEEIFSGTRNIYQYFPFILGTKSSCIFELRRTFTKMHYLCLILQVFYAAGGNIIAMSLPKLFVASQTGCLFPLRFALRCITRLLCRANGIRI